MPEIISDRRIAGLKLLAVLSGMAGIAYEVLFFRLLTNYFGDMFYVHATLLSIFLLGIGIGSKRAYRFQRYLYIVQICIGLYAFALPSILALIQRMRWLALTIDNAAFTSFLTAALLIVPSLLIGFSIPLFSSYLKAISHENAFKSIYAVYNLGAFVSVLAIELILIRNLGITGSLYFNAGLNVIVGAIVFFGYNDISRKEPQKEQGGNVFAPGIIAALGLASFASAVFQMFFYKTCFHIFDTNRENFAIGLAIGLVAISIGTSLVRRFRLRFETCMLLTIFFLGLIFGNFKAIHSLFISIWDFGQYSCSYRLLSKMAFASIYGLAPMIFFGATIPAILVEEKSVARDSGYLLWVSCIGNALGYLSYVYYGHVHFSNVGLIGFIAGLCLLACLLMHGIGYLNKRKFVLSGLLLLIVLMFFSWNEKDFYLANPSVPDLYKNEKISEFSLYKNGPDSVVLAGSREDLALFYNGHPGIEVFFKDRVNLGELASGVFSALYTDDYSRALVLGLGSGITAGATASIYENTDTVEINKAFAQIQSKLKRANFDVENNPKARIYYGDARIFLLGKEGRYSVIVNSVSRPDYFSAGKIYTLQFYRQVSKALKADGIFCTWVDKNMGEHGIVTVINTLSKVFKYCAAHRLRTGYYFLICAQRPLRPKYFHDVPASNALREELEKNLPFINLDDFFLYTQISADILKNRPFHDSRLLNTDDFPILEFFVLAAREGPLGRVPDLFLRFQRDLNVDFWMDFVEQKPLTLRQKADKCVALGVLMGNWREYCQEYCDAFLESNPRLKSTYLTLAEKKLEQHKDYYNARNIIAKSAYLNMLKGDRAKAEEYFKLLLDFDPLSIEAHRGLAAIYQGGELENKGLYLKHKIYYDFLMRSPR